MTTRPSLYVHEWLAVVAIAAFATALTWISNRQLSIPPSTELGAPHFTSDPRFEIKIGGAVAKPGIYQVKRGQTIKEVLELAQVLPEASLKGIKLNSKLRRNQLIHIPLQAMITIYVEGAVLSPGRVKLPKGSRINVLLDKIEFLDNADTAFLQKKRYLQDGEVIKIPIK